MIKPEIKNLVNAGKMLPLMEAFYTIQGEGHHNGTAAYFIRVGGCDVGCHWCDVKESWNAETHPPTSIDSIVANAEKYSDTIVITGGEPLTWDMGPLTQGLKGKGMTIHIETSGAYPLTGVWDWICLSPKKFQKPLETIKPLADELKIIVKNKSDFKWAEQQRVGVSEKCKLYLQPEWSNKEDMIQLIIDYVMKNPEWKISLQTHKYLQIP